MEERETPRGTPRRGSRVASGPDREQGKGALTERFRQHLPEGLGEGMRVLGVDTSTMAEGIGLAEGGRLVGELNSHLPRTHSERLLRGIRTLLEHLSLDAGQIDAFAVALGPGSFTGVRIGIATVQGLALAGGRPAVGLSTLETLAWWCRPGWEGWICPVMDAGRQEVYSGLYRSEGGEVVPIQEEVVSRPEGVLRGLPGEPVFFVGDGAGAHRERIRRRPGADPGDRILGLHPFLGGLTALVGSRRLAGGRGLGSPPLRPNYLRRPDAERKGAGGSGRTG